MNSPFEISLAMMFPFIRKDRCIQIQAGVYVLQIRDFTNLKSFVKVFCRYDSSPDFEFWSAKSVIFIIKYYKKWKTSQEKCTRIGMLSNFVLWQFLSTEAAYQFLLAQWEILLNKHMLESRAVLPLK